MAARKRPGDTRSTPDSTDRAGSRLEKKKAMGTFGVLTPSDASSPSWEVKLPGGGIIGHISAEDLASGKRRGRILTVTLKEPSAKIEVDPLRVKLAMVTDALGSMARAAKFLGVARSQPGKWLSGEENPNPRARRLIQDFDYVWSRLIDERPSETAAVWLSSPNAFLGGATPLVWLRTRGAEDVVGAIDAEEAGSYA